MAQSKRLSIKELGLANIFDFVGPETVCPIPPTENSGQRRCIPNRKVEFAMTRLAEWLGERPYRSAALNILMLTTLLALIGQPQLFLMIGTITIAVLALTGLRGTLARFRQSSIAVHPYELTFLWAPGAMAIIFAALGLWLILTSEAGSALYLLGTIFFGFEVWLLVLLGADLRAGRTASVEAR
jgi:hypothetical protein